MELISPNSKFDFIGKAGYFLVLSAILIGVSFYFWFALGESKYGLDFKGGHQFLVKIEEGSSNEGLQRSLEKQGLSEASVQNFEFGSHEYSIRLRGSEDPKTIKAQVESALKAAVGEKFSIIQSEFIGPTVGAELRRKALLATVVSLVAILLYVAFRFEFAFALGAVVAVFHDVILSTGAYIAVGHTLNMGTIAAALTIVGYSVNDTIVIFDRMREELLKQQKDFELVQLMNRCINITLSRTVVTSLLTFFSAVALLVLGGGAIADLSLFLVVGIVAGSYSTIFIASPIVLAWERFRTKKK